MNPTHTAPRVYVACLASYNAGRLHGTWVDATDTDELREGIAAVLKSSPIGGAEEWAFHDNDGFGGLIGEYEDVDKVAALGSAIVEHGPAFIAYAENIGADYATGDGFEESYQGEHDSEEDFAEQLAEDTKSFTNDSDTGRVVDAWPYNCIDWERAARDLFCGDYWSSSSPEGVYVFRSC
jgi:antirestriction protein